LTTNSRKQGANAVKNPLSLDNRAWSAGFLNVLLLLIQLYHVWRAQTAEGLSLVMLVGFVYIQLTFVQVGYRSKEWGLFWGLIISFFVTAILIALVVYLQHFKT